MAVRADSWRAGNWLAVQFALFGSLLVHALAYAVLSWAGRMPAVDFELKLPSEVQFGLSEPTPEQPAVPAAAPEPPAPTSPPASETIAPKPKPPKPKHRPPADAGAPDASAQAQADAGTPNAPAPDAGAPLLSAYAPAGAQLALRLHMGRVRESALADEVRVLLDAIPDWRSIVKGSDLDPLRDLERLYLASPDLERASVVIAGEYTGDEDLPHRAVEKLASARGIQATWHKRGNVAVAPWANADTTERVLALIAPHQFAITRPDDLPRVLAVAQALAQRAAKAGKPPGDPGEALLGLEQGELLAFSVEGAREFARGNLEGTPIRFELSVSGQGDQALAVEMRGEFEDSAGAEKARGYWERTRDRFAAHPLLAFIGMREPLADSHLSTDGKTLRFSTRVTFQQARVLLGFIRNAVEPPSGAVDARDPPSSPAKIRPQSREPTPTTPANPVSPPSP
jgi:hypothetical protein